MQVLADTLYRQSPNRRPTAAPADLSRDVDLYARMGSGRSLAARVRDYFARGWALHVENARVAAPITWL
ncbi:hypothetical protein LMG31506_01600 [Cupriavidus yeoncheonensis]|uniref:Uncharacterized protein n=1 Tax=Cupriavidus yeoncheonensis TaxID=1462994 RepID=A0A916IQS7_9BURK|nr:hypothetical protein [Cupriavidus yeoncheonensis]CAG2136026.1 hypothetical protein LMG31506_01600 [Cupriavidus yeoncheonensis]